MTFIITTCNRLDLLDRTLKSFLKYNTYPVDKYIMINDSGDPDICKVLNLKYPRFEIICNIPKIGLSASIDRAYNACTDEYIFHCEDDWEFHRPGFIEESILQLEDKSINQVWVRGQDDTPHKALPNGTIPIWNEWNGFSWNPGLRRLSDYRRMFPNGYAEFKDEFLCAQHSRQFEYKVVSLPGACIHIGYGAHTQNWID